jgi:glycine/D-amino acid oxidase-like deaminating enzyme
MPDLTRRSALAAAAATMAAPAIVRAQSLGSPGRIVVVGAGVFGAWTADHLLRAGHRVTLIDAWSPAHSRASSGGESRMTRAAYGKDDVYTRMAHDSLQEWKALSSAGDLPLFHPTGVLFMFQSEQAFAAESLATHRRLGLPTRRLERPELRTRFQGIEFADIAFGILEPDFGVLMARRGVQTLVTRFVAAGGRYVQAAYTGVEGGRPGELKALTLGSGRVEADRFVFATGPWLGKMFPDVVGPRLFVTRQEIYFFAPPAGVAVYQPGMPSSIPGWADWNGGDVWYGMPDIEGRGFKVAFDKHGPAMDPDTAERVPSAEGIAAARAYLGRRFPGLARAPLGEARVCQYENSANGDLLIDRHPQWRNVVLVGTGSGHGFKHGPEVGRYAAALATGTLGRVEPRFSLASNGVQQARDVH